MSLVESGIRGRKFRRNKPGDPVTVDGRPLFAEQGKAYYVDANRLGSGDGKSLVTPFSTMEEAFSVIKSGDTIRFRGKIREQLVAPVQVFDVRIVGLGNRPRHADSTPSGGEIGTNTWAAPASPTAGKALVEALQQGWSFENILFAGVSDAACVTLNNTGGSGDDERSAGHAMFLGCRFDAGLNGIEDDGGTYNVLVEDCIFRGQTGDGIKTLNTANAVPLKWRLRHNHFVDCANHMRVSASKWLIHDNFFGPIDNFGIDLIFVSAQGDLNIVTRNYLSGDYSTAAYKSGSNDEWAGNYSQDTDEAEVGDNGLTIAIPTS